MPLSALIDGERKTLVFMTNEEWRMLKARKADIILECCGARGFLRESKLGTKHFCHLNRHDGCTAGHESEQHMRLKGWVAEAVRECGWKAETEATTDPEKNWRADVLATRNSIQIAFEIQLSQITLEQLKKRQAAYAESGVRGCWFGRGYAARTLFRQPTKDIPIFWFGDDDRVDRNEIPERVLINQQLSMPVKAAVSSLLRKEIKWCDQMRRKTLEGLCLYRIYCPRCRKELVIYFLVEAQSSCHGVPSLEHAKLKLSRPDWESLDEPRFTDRIRHHIQVNREISQLMCYPTWENDQFGFSCVNCGELIGKRASHWIAWKTPVATIETSRQARLVMEPHWCYSENHSFCC